MNFHFPRSCTAWSLRQGIALVLPGPHDTDGIIPSGSEGPRKKWQWGHGARGMEKKQLIYGSIKLPKLCPISMVVLKFYL